VAGHTYVRGLELMTRYQKVYGLGHVLGDGILASDGILLSDNTVPTDVMVEGD
jgi:hypothetical protein